MYKFTCIIQVCLLWDIWVFLFSYYLEDVVSMVVKQYMVLLDLYHKKVIKSNKIDNQFKNL